MGAHKHSPIMPQQDVHVFETLTTLIKIYTQFREYKYIYKNIYILSEKRNVPFLFSPFFFN